MSNYTIVIITQIIENKTPHKQKIISSDQSHLHTEFEIRAKELQTMVQDKVKNLYVLSIY